MHSCPSGLCDRRSARDDDVQATRDFATLMDASQPLYTLTMGSKYLTSYIHIFYEVCNVMQYASQNGSASQIGHIAMCIDNLNIVQQMT